MVAIKIFSTDYICSKVT